MTKGMTFFASLRRFFAADYLEQSFKAVMEDAISRNILPRVRDLIDGTDDPSKLAKLNNLVELYEKYGNPRSSESNIFAETASSVVLAMAHQYNMGMDDAMDIGQDMALFFFKKPNWINAWDKFPVEKGPISLNRFMGHLLKRNAKWLFRDLSRRMHKPLETDDDDMDIADRTPAKEQIKDELDEKILLENIREMRKYIHRKFKPEWVKDMFDAWYRLAIRKGADSITMKRDVYPDIGDTYGMKESRMNEMWVAVRRAMLKFYEQEVGVKVTNRMKKKLHLGSVDLLVYEQFRRQIASWVLPFPIMSDRMRQQ